MKPYVICHMVASLDGRIDSRHWSRSPDGDRKAWSALYEEVHEALAGDAWLVGRITMEEMADGEPHPPAGAGPVVRPHYFARRAKSYALALDAGGQTAFQPRRYERRPSCDPPWPRRAGPPPCRTGKRRSDVPDRHLAELASDGLSYIVADGPEIDLPAMLDVLGSNLGIRRLLLEGGAGINGSFLAAGLVDEISLITVPAIDGRSVGRTVFESGEIGLADKVQLTLSACEKLKAGAVHLRYTVGCSAVKEPLRA